MNFHKRFMLVWLPFIGFGCLLQTFKSDRKQNKIDSHHSCLIVNSGLRLEAIEVFLSSSHLLWPNTWPFLSRWFFVEEKIPGRNFEVFKFQEETQRDLVVKLKLQKFSLGMCVCVFFPRYSEYFPHLLELEELKKNGHMFPQIRKGHGKWKGLTKTLSMPMWNSETCGMVPADNSSIYPQQKWNSKIWHTYIALPTQPMARWTLYKCAIFSTCWLVDFQVFAEEHPAGVFAIHKIKHIPYLLLWSCLPCAGLMMGVAIWADREDKGGVS